MNKEILVCSRLDEQRRILAYLDSFPLSRDLRQARLVSLRQLQSETQEELDALLPSHRDATQSVLPDVVSERQQTVEWEQPVTQRSEMDISAVWSTPTIRCGARSQTRNNQTRLQKPFEGIPHS